MKKIILFSLLSFLRVFSQDNGTDVFLELRDSAFILKANYFYNIYENEKNRNNDNNNWNTYLKKRNDFFSNIYVINEYNYPIQIKNTNENYTFKEIDIFKNTNKRALRKGVSVWRCNSYINDNQLTFIIGERIVKYKNKKYTFGIVGSSTIVFQYSCEEKKWVLIKEEHTGI